MKATTVIIAITVDGDHDEATQHLGDRVGHLLNVNWHGAKLPHRIAQDIRVHRYSAGAIGDLLNKRSLAESA